jgi:membrane associated rhomboid family serine protease
MQSRFVSQTLRRQAGPAGSLKDHIAAIAAMHSRTRLAIYIIIGINTAVFGSWQYSMITDNRTLSQVMREKFLTSNMHMKAQYYFSLVGAAFSHHNPTHFLFNMLSFFTMGSLLVLMPGMRAFHIVGITLSSGVLGNIAQLYNNPPGDRVLLGASGAVMGIAAVATCYAPFTPMNFMFIPINIPLWVFTVGYALLDSCYIKSESSHVGHAAHVGGALTGVAYYMLFLRKYGRLLRMFPKNF